MRILYTAIQILGWSSSQELSARGKEELGRAERRDGCLSNLLRRFTIMPLRRMGTKRDQRLCDLIELVGELSEHFAKSGKLEKVNRKEMGFASRGAAR